MEIINLRARKRIPLELHREILTPVDVQSFAFFWLQEFDGLCRDFDLGGRAPIAEDAAADLFGAHAQDILADRYLLRDAVFIGGETKSRSACVSVRTANAGSTRASTGRSRKRSAQKVWIVLM